MKYYTIPFFVPHRGCPHKCVFCDQRSITGELTSATPLPEDIKKKIETYLATMPKSGVYVQVGFFGGSFTGISEEDQKKFLSPVMEFLDDGRVKGVRLSTRPDLIGQKKIDFLSAHGVSCIELGVQSMFRDVLDASGRGHTPEHTVEASRLILKNGLDLTHQIMIGLPESSYDKEFLTARMAVDLGASQVRIYPVIVMKGTELAEMWRKKEYAALEMEEALERSAKLISFFRRSNVKVIRCGLHASEALLSGEKYLAGPFHQSFGHYAAERANKIC